MIAHRTKEGEYPLFCFYCVQDIVLGTLYMFRFILTRLVLFFNGWGNCMEDIVLSTLHTFCFILQDWYYFSMDVVTKAQGDFGNFSQYS